MMSPLAKLEEGVFGTDSKPGVGLPQRVIDESKLLIDFMPFYTRTVQRYGIKIDDINYFSHSIVPWINSIDPNNPKIKQKFTIRRDPRDISLVYFFDPIDNFYLSIPYQNISHPRMTLSELKSVKSQLKSEGKRNINEEAIFAAYDEMKKIVDTAVQTTRTTKRSEARKRYAQKAASETQKHIKKPVPSTVDKNSESNDIFSEKIVPFSDINFR